MEFFASVEQALQPRQIPDYAVSRIDWREGGVLTARREYTVTLEKQVLDGLGIVDLVLEKRGCVPVACEICVTTSPDHELQNAEKCLAAGFEKVFLVAPDKEVLQRVRSRAASVRSEEHTSELQSLR